MVLHGCFFSHLSLISSKRKKQDASFSATIPLDLKFIPETMDTFSGGAREGGKSAEDATGASKCLLPETRNLWWTSGMVLQWAGGSGMALRGWEKRWMRP